ncbi:MAG TPA: sigma-70 family RNA polymerase sigma factor [Chitinophagaceae bacterium]|nr:sigma-70 family RNA polymerase sigma factor [Chitinophagaceae bacterium]
MPLELHWLKQLQQNDEHALSCLMKNYYTDLYNYAAKFSQDQSLVKDCIQEVFISLWQRRDTATAILCPRYYLLRAVKNKMLKSLYAKSRSTGLEQAQDYDFSTEFSIERTIIEKQISEEKAEKLRRTLSLLSKRQKEVIYLKYYQYLDNTQIAELMNISRQSVYNLLHETIQKLKTVWRAEFIPNV